MLKKLTLCISTLLAFSISSQSSAADAPRGEYIVLLHGIFNNDTFMHRSETFLKQAGYDVINIDYPSTDHDIKTLSEKVQATINEKYKNKEATIHYVGFSMGNLLIRTLLGAYKPPNLGRVVMMGPPNQGSEVADFLKKYKATNAAFNALFGPAGQQLSTDKEGYHTELPKVDYELGIIAGDKSIMPISSMILPGKDDGKVTVESTKLDGMKDHIVLPLPHSIMPQSESAAKQVTHFIQNGTFNHTADK